MADVKLILTADSSDAVKNIVKIQDASKKTGTTVDELKQQMKNLFDVGKKGFSNIKDVEAYTKAMSDLKEQIKILESEQQKLNEQQNKSTGFGDKAVTSLMNWAKGIGIAALAAKGFKEVIQSTDTLSDKFAATLNGWKEGFKAMARAIANNDFKDFFKNVQAAVKEGQRFAETEDKIGDAERRLRIQIAANKTAFDELRVVQGNTNLSNEKRLEAGLKAEKLLKQDAQDRLDLAKAVLDNDMKNAAFVSKQSEDIIANYLKQEPVLMRQIEIGKQYNDLIEARNVLLGETAGGYLNPTETPEVKAIQAKIDAMGSEAVAYGALAVGLGNITDAQKDKITSDYEAIESSKQSAFNLRVLSRNDALEAAQSKELNKERVKDQKETYQQLQEQYLAYRDVFFAEIDTNNKKREKEWNDEVDFQRKLAKSELEIAKDKNEKRLKADADGRKKEEELEKFSLQQRQENIQKFGSITVDYLGILDDLQQKEVERTQRQRELLDTQISEAQQALETEVELYKAGYASNVAAKQKEVNDLKKARDKALKDEEAARRKAHAIQLAAVVAQKAVDVASMWASYGVAQMKAIAASPLTGGLPWTAINTVALALNIAAAVAAIAAASKAKFAKGGWTGDGAYRDSTGERMAGIVHEKEFVIKRGPAHKFRDVLEAINRDDRRMILTSFNKLNPELIGGTNINHVVVENEGPNKRLDQVNYQLRKLNSRREEITDLGRSRIIRNGQNIRIISR